jgi:transcriptional regulator with XRE-family HTH domain
LDKDSHSQLSPEGDEPSVVQNIGARVRRLRKVRGLSLTEVATRTGLSSGFLSQLERGISSGSIRAFAQIAEALDVTLGDIFAHAGRGHDGFAVTRTDQREVVDFPEALASKDILARSPGEPPLDMYILTMEPGGRSGDEPFSHKGLEAGYILEGGIELVVDGRREILGPGDSFVFESRLRHSYRNAGQVRLRAIWVNYAGD